ncbi:Transmembrane and TPR repeat-containing protein 4 [Acipenser ruthenus]|uniref:Transmembrane and TPR repeat-containing protein 4 n=1 Tax=Acipenser ruthenus TaxID=7906 RepID=A0A444UQ05_ACIRT|nr:Transmembrane and TPR repeat-containing protein 4 [Acipenser ruthenus]
MVQSEVHLDHHIALPQLPRYQAQILVGLVAFFCFGNSYDGDFVFDDSEAIVNNKVCNELNDSINRTCCFRFNYLLGGGLHPVGFHVLNIALHCVISALMINVFAILIGGLAYDGKGKRLNLAPKASFLAALLFAVHPVHTESVAGIVGRADLLSALFFQLSLISYCKAFYGSNKEDKFSIPWILLSILWCAVAMLCKEQGITVLGVNASIDILMICKVNIIELSQRLLHKGKPSENNKLLKRGFLTRMGLLTLGGSSLLYIRWRIMGTGPPAFTEVDNPASFADSILDGPPAFTEVDNPASFADSILERKVLCAGVLALLCVNVIRCILRSSQWRSEEQLFKSALSVCPLNAKVHYNVGKNLADQGNQTSAIKYYREAVRPDFAAAWMNLGIVQNSLKKFEEAENSYWNAIKFRKKYPDCYYNLGRLYADLNRHVDALNAWRNATVLKPDHSLAWNNMVILLDNTGNLAQAEMIGKESLKLLPKDHTIMFSLANVLGKLQKYKESEGLFLTALKINPHIASYHAVLYHRWGKLDLAKKHYELSLKLDPMAPGTKENYNMLRRKLEQLQKGNA